MPPTKPKRTLVAAIKDATRAAFAAVQARAAGEELYVFALYSEWGTDLQPTANTTEGLARAVTQALGKRADAASAERRAAKRAELRWFLHEFAHHRVGEKAFDKLEEEFSRPAARDFASAITALQELDAEGLFGSGADRDALTILLLRADASDQPDERRLALAEQLNPKPVVDRLAASLALRAPTPILESLGDGRLYSGDSLSIGGGIVAVSAWFGEDAVHAWTEDGERVLKAHPRAGKAFEVCVAEDGSLVAVRTDAAILRFQTAPGQKAKPLPRMAVPKATAMLLAGGRLTYATPRAVVSVDALSLEQPVARDLAVHAMAAGPDGALYVAGAKALLRLDAELRDAGWSRPTARVTSLAVSPTGRHIAVARAHEVALLSTTTDEITVLREHRRARFTDVAFDATGQRLAACDDDAWVWVWDVDDGAEVFRARGKHEALSGVRFVRDGRFLGAVGRDVRRGPPIVLFPLPPLGAR